MGYRPQSIHWHSSPANRKPPAFYMSHSHSYYALIVMLVMPFALHANPWNRIDEVQAKLNELGEVSNNTEIGGSLRLRYHNEQNFRITSAVPNKLGLTGADGRFLLKRTKLWIDHTVNENLRVYTEVMDAVANGTNHLPRLIDENRLDLHQLYIETDFNTDWTARVGRQWVGLGSQRLISSLEWANTRRPYDGALFSRDIDAGKLTAFWMQPASNLSHQPDDTNHKITLYGLYLDGAASETRKQDLYWISMNNKIANLQTDTLGTLIKGQGSQWKYEFEGGVQLGTNSDASDHLAGFTSIGIGRDVEHDIGGTIWFIHDWGSGDSTMGNGFHYNFPMGHRYMGFMDLYSRSNLHDFNIRWTRQFTDTCELLIWYHYFALADPSDGPYNVNMTPFAGHPTATPNSRDLGHEIDLRATFKLREYSTLVIGYSHFFSGSYYQQPGLPFSGDANFFYTQFTIGF